MMKETSADSVTSRVGSFLLSFFAPASTAIFILFSFLAPASTVNSVWPAWWSTGTDWPAGGEIDTFEGVNQQTNNQMALREFSLSRFESYSKASADHLHILL